jgi:MFS family permease
MRREAFEPRPASPCHPGRHGHARVMGADRSPRCGSCLTRGVDLEPGTRFESNVPNRLDRLPWSGWHWRLIVALGVAWALDGLEVTVVGAVGSVLGERDTLGLSAAEVGASASAYLSGAITGALVFGRMTDTLGRKRLFLITLGVYLVATLATALAWNFASFAAFRAITGAGIGGEAAAVNSAIDELLPARVRGRADLAINGTYWLGTALGSGASLLLLNPLVLPHSLGWRVVFGLGAATGFSVLLVRRHLPESPRWLLLHGRLDEAERVVDAIEREVTRLTGHTLEPPQGASELQVKGRVSFANIAHVLIRRNRSRTLLGLVLMSTQAFVYNGVFFTYSLVLSRFYGVPSGRVGLYLLPFALGNLLGPLLLGPLFDTLGRRVMITCCYGASGGLLLLAGIGLAHHWFTASSQTAAWCAVFFVASAAASSAYLTVSELFPVELRGMAISLFYAIGTAIGGVAAPWLFGALLETNDRQRVLIGYVVGAALMVVAAAVEGVLGVAAEGKPLEMINRDELPQRAAAQP